MSRISAQLYVYLQSVQAYISPPIAAVFLLGVFWKRINGAGALTSLLVGFVLGALRFMLEIAYAGTPLAGLAGVYVGMNFLHFAVLMFVICVVVLIAVSLMTPAPAPDKVAGLTFQTVRGKIDLDEADAPDATGAVTSPARSETFAGGRLNSIFAGLLVVTIISLWIYFA